MSRAVATTEVTEVITSEVLGNLGKQLGGVYIFTKKKFAQRVFPKLIPQKKKSKRKKELTFSSMEGYSCPFCEAKSHCRGCVDDLGKIWCQAKLNEYDLC